MQRIPKGDEWLINQESVLIRGTWTGWRNRPTVTSEVRLRQMPSPAPGEKQLQAPVPVGG